MNQASYGIIAPQIKLNINGQVYNMLPNATMIHTLPGTVNYGSTISTTNTVVNNGGQPMNPSPNVSFGYPTTTQPMWYQPQALPTQVQQTQYIPSNQYPMNQNISSTMQTQFYQNQPMVQMQPQQIQQQQPIQQNQPTQQVQPTQQIQQNQNVQQIEEKKEGEQKDPTKDTQKVQPTQQVQQQGQQMQQLTQQFQQLQVQPNQQQQQPWYSNNQSSQGYPTMNQGYQVQQGYPTQQQQGYPVQQQQGYPIQQQQGYYYPQQQQSYVYTQQIGNQPIIVNVQNGGYVNQYRYFMPQPVTYQVINGHNIPHQGGVPMYQGVTKQQLSLLPLSKYGDDDGDADIALLDPEGESEMSTDKTCAICTLDYEKGDLIRKLKCRHTYHQECIDDWLGKKNECCLCKAKVV